MEIGKVDDVNPRALWANEARDFTPWLLDNADVLSKALGLEVSLRTAEHPVGDFALDIVGDDGLGGTLIVENQLEHTNHDHLGKVITYAAGTDAKTIVWIATRIRAEHRQALDWLNANTREDVRLFGIELRAIKIGDSASAPLLEVVAQPNDWQKAVRSATAGAAATGRQALYVTFWTKLLDRIRAEHPDWSGATRAPRDNWFTTRSPLPGTQLNFVFPAGQRLCAELWIEGGDGDVNLALFHRLESHRPTLELAFGTSLDFLPLPDRRGCRIGYYHQGDVADVERYDEFVAWFLDAGAKWRRALAEVVPLLAS